MMNIHDINRLIKNSILFLVLGASVLLSQSKDIEKRGGVITYISSQYIYARFSSTDSISIGDTLYYSQSGKEIPAVIVRHISSTSSACERITNLELNTGDKLTAVITSKDTEPKTDTIINDNKDKVVINKATFTPRPQRIISKKNHWGRFSIQSLSSFSNTNSKDNQRWRYSFSYKADSISSSGVSFSSYFFFAYNTRDWSYIKNNIGSALKIYDLNVGYTFGNKSKVWLGRYLNPKITNVGAIDGIQYQHQLGKYYIGAAVGSHPNFTDYGYNVKMFEYGAYAGRIDTFSSSQMENTIAYMNQTNDFNTDRRYLYFQHTNNLIDKTNLFASTEFDLYKMENGSPKNNFSLTSLFVNLYYSPIRLLSFSLSFDARRNAIYYETYKTYIENLLSNELRKGYRFSVYLRPLNSLTFSFNGGYSKQDGDPKSSNNYGANLYCSTIPLLALSGSLTYSKLNSSYTNGTISGVRLSKYINSLDLNLSADYKNIRYEFNSSTLPVVQNTISGEISFRLPYDLYMGINYEGVFEKLNTYGRFYIDLNMRF